MQVHEKVFTGANGKHIMGYFTSHRALDCNTAVLDSETAVHTLQFHFHDMSWHDPAVAPNPFSV